MAHTAPLHLVINAFALQDQYQNRGIGRYTQEVIQEIIRLLQKKDRGIKDFDVTLVISQQQVPVTISNTNLERLQLWKIPSFVPRRSSTQFLHAFLFVRNSLRRLQEKIKQQGQRSIIFLPHHNLWRPNYFDCSVVMVHDLYPITSGQYSPSPLLAPVKKAEFQYYLKQLNDADLIVTNSKYTAQEVKEHITKEVPVQPIPLGISTKFIKPPRLQKRLRPTPLPYFIYWGGYDQNKNVPTIVNQIIALNTKRKNPVALVLVGGERVLNQYQALIKKHNAQQWLLFTPTVDDETLVHYVGNSLGLIRLSFHEGFGLPELETMALGKPVISTTAGAIPEVAGAFSDLYDPHNPKGIIKKLDELAMVDTDAARLKQAQRYARSMTWQKNVQELLESIREMCRDQS